MPNVIDTGSIHPDQLYTREAFFTAAGIGSTTLRQAERRGIPLPHLKVGRRNLYRGRDCIEWLEKVAESKQYHGQYGRNATRKR